MQHDFSTLGTPGKWEFCQRSHAFCRMPANGLCKHIPDKCTLCTGDGSAEISRMKSFCFTMPETSGSPWLEMYEADMISGKTELNPEMIACPGAFKTTHRRFMLEPE